MTDHVLFCRVATLLYGHGFHGALADDLNLNIRSVERMAKGESPIPAGVWIDIGDRCRERAKELLAVSDGVRG